MGSLYLLWAISVQRATNNPQPSLEKVNSWVTPKNKLCIEMKDLLPQCDSSCVCGVSSKPTMHTEPVTKFCYPCHVPPTMKQVFFTWHRKQESKPDQSSKWEQLTWLVYTSYCTAFQVRPELYNKMHLVNWLIQFSCADGWMMEVKSEDALCNRTYKWGKTLFLVESVWKGKAIQILSITRTRNCISSIMSLNQKNKTTYA